MNFIINTKNKGNRIRLLAIKNLEKQGYWVDTVEKANKFARVKDLFGLFDLIAIRRQWNKIELRFVQVKSNQKPPLAEYKKFKDRYGGEFKSYSESLGEAQSFKLSVEVWVKYDREIEFEKVII